jgi:hypothetical protein
MRKSDEMAKSNSCWNQSLLHELLFVLPERDPAAATTVNFWIRERIRLDLNRPNDPKLLEAQDWIAAVLGALGQGRVCLHCQKRFLPKRKNEVACRPACKLALKRKRDRACQKRGRAVPEVRSRKNAYARKYAKKRHATDPVFHERRLAQGAAYRQRRRLKASVADDTPVNAVDWNF